MPRFEHFADRFREDPDGAVWRMQRSQCDGRRRMERINCTNVAGGFQIPIKLLDRPPRRLVEMACAAHRYRNLFVGVGRDVKRLRRGGRLTPSAGDHDQPQLL